MKIHPHAEPAAHTIEMAPLLPNEVAVPLRNLVTDLGQQRLSAQVAAVRVGEVAAALRRVDPALTASLRLDAAGQLIDALQTQQSGTDERLAPATTRDALSTLIGLCRSALADPSGAVSTNADQLQLVRQRLLAISDLLANDAGPVADIAELRQALSQLRAEVTGTLNSLAMEPYYAARDAAFATVGVAVALAVILVTILLLTSRLDHP